MSYTILTPQPQGLASDETALQLSNCVVAARSSIVMGGDGNPIVSVHARCINADGTPYKDGHGQPVTAAYSVSATRAVVTPCGSVRALQKCALLLLLGESFAPFVPPIPIGTGVDIVSRMQTALDLTTCCAADLLSPATT